MDTAPFWPTTLAGNRSPLLDRDTARHLDPTPDVAVVGGGIVGLAIAVMCRRAGLDRVVVLERDRLVSGPSGRAGGVLAPEAHAWTDPPSLVELGRQSLELTRQLDVEWHGELGVRDLSCLLADRRLDEVVTPLATPVEVLDEAAIRDREPALRGVTNALLIRRQAHVHPLTFAAALALRAGGILTGVEVGAPEVVGGSVVRLPTGVGDVRPGVVIYATGTAPSPDITVPHVLVKGHLAVTEPVQCRLVSRVVTLRGGALPLPDGRLLTGGTIDVGDSGTDVRPTVVRGIRRALDDLIPAAAGAAFSHVWTCSRPATPDRLPIIDRLPGTDNAWFTSGHYGTGLLMALATGESLARWITDGHPPQVVRPFALARFGPQIPEEE